MAYKPYLRIQRLKFTTARSLCSFSRTFCFHGASTKLTAGRFRAIVRRPVLRPLFEYHCCAGRTTKLLPTPPTQITQLKCCGHDHSSSDWQREIGLCRTYYNTNSLVFQEYVSNPRELRLGHINWNLQSQPQAKAFRYIVPIAVATDLSLNAT